MSGINSAKLDNCLVVGNGESRKNIDLNQIKKDYTVIGCNALFRDVISDYLVCCDRRMVEEAVNNLKNTDVKIYIRDDWFQYYTEIKKNKNILELPEIPYTPKYRQDEKRNWGSGTYGLLIAAQLGFKNVTLLGFDLYPISKDSYKIKNGGYVYSYKQETVNNIYKDTANYSNSTSQAVDPSNWIYQISRVFSLYPTINFNIINNSDWIMPKEWNYSNVSFTNIDELIT